MRNEYLEIMTFTGLIELQRACVNGYAEQSLVGMGKSLMFLKLTNDSGEPWFHTFWTDKAQWRRWIQKKKTEISYIILISLNSTYDTVYY